MSSLKISDIIFAPRAASSINFNLFCSHHDLSAAASLAHHPTSVKQVAHQTRNVRFCNDPCFARHTMIAKVATRSFATVSDTTNLALRLTSRFTLLQFVRRITEKLGYFSQLLRYQILE
ncbi:MULTISPECIES: hypothetical protein [Bradyrhizobium]|uniref:hypothetical protein n=1 Tax=Bradyrhizobium TaxID=374 RepID=UPI00114331EB|nr:MULTISPECIES: hypothetical protein [Bradyrhizobium]UFW51017.1 hypothetical protein BaraCB756_08260 [Bradyrhizobium arachidis]